MRSDTCGDALNQSQQNLRWHLMLSFMTKYRQNKQLTKRSSMTSRHLDRDYFFRLSQNKQYFFKSTSSEQLQKEPPTKCVQIHLHNSPAGPLI